MAIILDGERNSPASLSCFLAALKGKELLNNYKAINAKGHARGLNLESESGKDMFFTGCPT